MSDKSGFLAGAFAEHLRRRSDHTALLLCEALQRNDLSRRATVLRGFVDDGPHTVAADWWEPGMHCRVGMLPPPVDEMVSGELWFDPLDVTWSIAIPWPRTPGIDPDMDRDLPSFLCWFPLDRVTYWQLAGAQQVSADIPATMADVSAINAWRYCTLFGKALTGHSTWGMLTRICGKDTALRLFGDSPGEVSPGGNSGEAVMLYRDDILNSADPDAPYPQTTSEDSADGLSFRADLDLQFGFIQEDHTLPRVWNA